MRLGRGRADPASPVEHAASRRAKVPADDEDDDEEEEEEEGEEVSMEDRRLKKDPPFFPEGLDVLECLADLRCLILSCTALQSTAASKAELLTPSSVICVPVLGSLHL